MLDFVLTPEIFIMTERSGQSVYADTLIGSLHFPMVCFFLSYILVYMLTAIIPSSTIIQPYVHNLAWRTRNGEHVCSENDRFWFFFFIWRMSFHINSNSNLTHSAWNENWYLDKSNHARTTISTTTENVIGVTTNDETTTEEKPFGSNFPTNRGTVFAVVLKDWLSSVAAFGKQ